MLLNDKTIRASLISRLSALPNRPKAILEELRVHNGNAIADVVSISKFAHCYEIKGETDSIYRVARQGSFYDRAFIRTTLVTTAGQINKALSVAPSHWGIMVASNSNKKITLRYVRSAGASPTYDNRVALLTLWRSELLDVAASIGPNAQKLNRTQLSEVILLKLGKQKICETVSEKLATRHTSPYIRDM